MKPMRERNQIVVALVGTAVAVAVVLLSLNLGRIPFLHPSKTYHAQFANADGLKGGDDVRVAGINVGKVKKVDVEGDHVRIDFTVKAGLKLGDASRASIEVATVLGNLFMQVESAGAGQLRSGQTIPVQRTTVPYTLIGALNQFGEFSKQTDLPKLRESLKTLSQTINGISPKEADAALKGLADVAQTLAGKQAQISQILTSATAITNTLNSNSGALVSLLMQGDEFLQLIEQRHQVISDLLRDTARLGTQLSQLIATNGAQLQGLLGNLNSVTAVLAKEKDQLQRATAVLGQFSINVTNATGSGPWLDLLTPVAVVPDNQIVGCGQNPNTALGPCQ
jgi:phospholipid/cholesterol/gamma-HCH transport system substrate-binding protein